LYILRKSGIIRVANVAILQKGVPAMAKTRSGVTKNTTTKSRKGPLSESYKAYQAWIEQGRPGGKFIDPTKKKK
jgi:hypothetical protein